MESISQYLNLIYIYILSVCSVVHVSTMTAISVSSICFHPTDTESLLTLKEQDSPPKKSLETAITRINTILFKKMKIVQNIFSFVFQEIEVYDSKLHTLRKKEDKWRVISLKLYVISKMSRRSPSIQISHFSQTLRIEQESLFLMT